MDQQQSTQQNATALQNATTLAALKGIQIKEVQKNTHSKKLLPKRLKYHKLASEKETGQKSKINEHEQTQPCRAFSLHTAMPV